MWWLNDDYKIKCFLEKVTEMRVNGLQPRVSFVDPVRTLDQNGMIYAVYKQIAQQKEDESVIDIKRHCKAYYGIPILLAEDEAFAKMYRKGIMNNLTTEEKLEAMDILPVTSRFSKKQATEYIDIMIREYSKQGISLVNPAEVDSYGQS
jgi:hypothetical protein